MSNRDEIVDEAIAWQQAIARDDGIDWEAFTHWLEADANRRAVFDEVASIDAAIDEHRSAIRLLLDPEPASEQLEAANDAPKSAGRRWFIGTSIAAALALAVGLPLIQSDQPGQTDYATAPGKTR